MDPFTLSQSRLYASLLGMNPVDAKHYRTMAATLDALHQNTLRALRERPIDVR